VIVPDSNLQIPGNVLSLGTVWAFLQPIFQDLLKSKFSSHPPNLTKAAKELYRAIERGQDSSSKLAQSLREYVDGYKAGVPESFLQTSIAEVVLCMRIALTDALSIAGAARAVNPALSIHMPHVDRNLAKYVSQRRQLADRIPEMTSSEAEELANIAALNAERIRHTAADLRRFLAEQFTFKELL
jgi:hypothetical protein